MLLTFKNLRKRPGSLSRRAQKCEQARTVGVYRQLHSPPLSRILTRTIDNSQESSYCNSGRAFGAIRLRVVSPRRPRDIEMRPRYAVRKLFQKSRRGYRSRFAATDVLDVRDIRFDLFRIFLVEWQLP